MVIRRPHSHWQACSSVALVPRMWLDLDSHWKSPLNRLTSDRFNLSSHRVQMMKFGLSRVVKLNLYQTVCTRREPRRILYMLMFSTFRLQTFTKIDVQYWDVWQWIIKGYTKSHNNIWWCLLIMFQLYFWFKKSKSESIPSIIPRKKLN